MPMARRGPRAIAAPRSVPPTPANGSSTSSPVRLKNSMSRAISRGGLLAPWALRSWCPSSDGYAVARQAGAPAERLGGDGADARPHELQEDGERADSGVHPPEQPPADGRLDDRDLHDVVRGPGGIADELLADQERGADEDRARRC